MIDSTSMDRQRVSEPDNCRSLQGPAIRTREAAERGGRTRQAGGMADYNRV